MRKPCNKPVHHSKLGKLIFNIEYSILAPLNVNNFFLNHTAPVCSRVNQPTVG